MEKQLIASIILWGLAISMSLIVGFSLITSVIYVDDKTLAYSDLNDDVEHNGTTVFNSDYVTLEIDESYHMNVYVNSGNLDISIKNDKDSSNIQFESETIDNDMSSTANVGLCITGLNSDNSPTKIEFEEDNKMNTSINLNQSKNDEIYTGKTAQEIVDKCTDY